MVPTEICSEVTNCNEMGNYRAKRALMLASGFVAVVRKFVLSENNRGEIAMPSMLSNLKEVLNHCACIK